MSGTSVDSIDAALVEIRGEGPSTRIRLIAFGMFPFSPKVRRLILENSLPGTGSVDAICRINVLLAHLYAGAVRKLARRAGYRLADIDLIGSHGQTVHHLPRAKRFFGTSIRSTLQLGDPSTLAKLTGIPTVGDFRLADMALGGQGAPLVPYVDYLLFRSRTKTRILLNLGGIANLTFLPRNCSPGQVVAFDTGPANMVVDGLARHLYRAPFDRGGRFALRGKADPGLLRRMMSHPFLKKRPAKSTGREEFGEAFLKSLLRQRNRLHRDDLLATAAAFTAASVADQYRRFVPKKPQLDEVLVSGGGVHNRAIMRCLAEEFAPVPVSAVDGIGMPADAKEAVCFAVLANETIAGQPSNLPRVTGARAATVLGKICL